MTFEHKDPGLPGTASLLTAGVAPEAQVFGAHSEAAGEIAHLISVWGPFTVATFFQWLIPFMASLRFVFCVIRKGLSAACPLPLFKGMD